MSIALNGTATGRASAGKKVRPEPSAYCRNKVTEDNPYSLVICISLLIGFWLLVEFGPILYPRLIIH
jgi:hypothetical protein